MIDVPVVLIFFNRDKPLSHVFDSIRKAKPTKLFLIQDGPRSSNSYDSANIKKCREVLENIDWDCKVYKNYSDVNLGCGQRVRTGLDWVFSIVDRAIILEDDCVASQSFYPFCKDLLERFEHDVRVSQICGMNHLGEYKGTNDSYFFSNTGSCWGWATWKRCWDLMEYDMPYIKDENVMNSFLSNYLYNINDKASQYVRHGKRLLNLLDKNKKLSAWTYQFNMTKCLYSQYNIVSTKNLINNIGMTEDSTHTAGSYDLLPSGVRDVYFMKTHDISFPLIHPKYKFVDDRFESSVNKMMGIGFFRNKLKRLETIMRKVYYYGRR